MQWHTLFYVLLLCLARVDAQCSAGFFGSGVSTNVALLNQGTTAYASSSYGTYYPATGAFDGTVDGSSSPYYVRWHSTIPGNYEWIGVDLGSSKSISSIRYYPWAVQSPTDIYTFRVGQSSTFTSNPSCASLSLNKDIVYTDVPCVATGRYVSMHRQNPGHMAVTELQVFSEDIVNRFL
jgi:hypothetical protein